MTWRIEVTDKRTNTSRLSMNNYKDKARALEHIKLLQTLSESDKKEVRERHKHVKFYEYQAVKVGGRR